MNFTSVSSVIVLMVAISSSQVAAQSDFFFSFDRGGPNVDQTMNFEVGDTGSLWIYWTTNGPADSDLDTGAFIDVISSNSGVIEFTQAQTFDYDITVGEIDIGNRLLDDDGGGGFVGPASDVAADFVDELAAFTVVGGPGIVEPTGSCLLYTSPSPRDATLSRMPASA